MILPLVGFVLSDSQAKEEDPRMAGFDGKIAKTFEESEEDWPEDATFTGDEPNVPIILLDDVGYAQFGAFAGDSQTP